MDFSDVRRSTNGRCGNFTAAWQWVDAPGVHFRSRCGRGKETRGDFPTTLRGARDRCARFRAPWLHRSEVRGSTLTVLRKDRSRQFADAPWPRTISSVVALAGKMPQGDPALKRHALGADAILLAHVQPSQDDVWRDRAIRAVCQRALDSCQAIGIELVDYRILGTFFVSLRNTFP